MFLAHLRPPAGPSMASVRGHITNRSFQKEDLDGKVCQEYFCYRNRQAQKLWSLAQKSLRRVSPADLRCPWGLWNPSLPQGRNPHPQFPPAGEVRSHTLIIGTVWFSLVSEFMMTGDLSNHSWDFRARSAICFRVALDYKKPTSCSDSFIHLP